MRTTLAIVIGFTLGLLALDHDMNPSMQALTSIVLGGASLALLLATRSEAREGTAPAGWKITKASGGNVVITCPQGIAYMASTEERTPAGRQLYRLANAMRENEGLIDAEQE